MKNRKHRIFIIGKRAINRLNENNTHSNQDDKQQIDANSNKQRGESKRKKLFSELPQAKEKSQKKTNGKYVYQIKQHIKTESIEEIFKCDLFNSEQKINSKSKQQKLNIIRDSGQDVWLSGSNKNPQNCNEKAIKLEMKPTGQINNDKKPNRKQNNIFENENFRQNRVMSSHSGNPRRNIFFTFQSPSKALNKTFAKERRRIFSLDDTPLLQISEKKSSIIQQIRSLIKEQQQLEQSKINERIPIHKEQNMIPLISS